MHSVSPWITSIATEPRYDHPQANSGPEYFDQAMSYGLYRVEFRKEIDWILDGLQATLDS
jgi:hypothetical protein